MDSNEIAAEGSAFSFKYSDLPEIVMVELPFFASSTDSAYSTLGGEKKMKMMILKLNLKLKLQMHLKLYYLSFEILLR